MPMKLDLAWSTRIDHPSDVRAHGDIQPSPSSSEPSARLPGSSGGLASSGKAQVEGMGLAEITIL